MDKGVRGDMIYPQEHIRMMKGRREEGHIFVEFVDIIIYRGIEFDIAEFMVDMIILIKDHIIRNGTMGNLGTFRIKYGVNDMRRRNTWEGL